jgi:hypothetical protein
MGAQPFKLDRNRRFDRASQAFRLVDLGAGRDAQEAPERE